METPDLKKRRISRRETTSRMRGQNRLGGTHGAGPIRRLLSIRAHIEKCEQVRPRAKLAFEALFVGFSLVFLLLADHSPLGLCHRVDAIKQVLFRI